MVLPDAAALLGGLIESSRFGVIAVDSAGILREWSRGAERLFGWRADEVLGRAAASALQLPVLPQGESGLRLRRKDGASLDVWFWTGPWTGPTGNTQGTVTIAAETGPAERKLALVEQELIQMTAKESEARSEMVTERRFRELLEAAPDAIIEVDRQGRIVLVNRVTEKLFGYSRAELLGQAMEMLVPDVLRADHAGHRADYWDLPITRPMGSGLDLHGRRKDGSAIPVEISLSPVKSEDGFRVTAIIRDISQRRGVEERLRELERSHTLELESRNREIERANQMKTEFLASMSHELRTPLHTIIGFSELLAEEIEGPLNTKQRRFIGHIHTDSLHLLELINDILDISRIESGRLELRREVFDFAAAIDETVSSVRPQASAKSIELEMRRPAPATIFADRLRIKQVLLNLLSNALKFTPDGGRIVVEAAMRVGFLEVSVSDTGIGIPKDRHEAVFDKFYQLGATTRGVREGTGLGLAITKALVAEHGGRIWLESEPGKGSRFTFTIGLEGFREDGAHSRR